MIGSGPTAGVCQHADMPSLILMRHGQSAWNLENLFTGWVDVDLSAQGRQEAEQAGREIAKAGFMPLVGPGLEHPPRHLGPGAFGPFLLTS